MLLKNSKLTTYPKGDDAAGVFYGVKFILGSGDSPLTRGAACSKCPLGSAPARPLCASSGRAWWLWEARHSQEAAGPLGA